MKIKWSDSSDLCYQLIITYYTLDSKGNLLESDFEKYSDFYQYVDENHPKVFQSPELLNKLNAFCKEYDSLVCEIKQKSESEVSFDFSHEKYFLHCCLCGDEIYFSKHKIGIIEKINQYKSERDKCYDGYIMSFKCHNWTYSANSDKCITINYWYDENNVDARVFNIICFKDRVIFESAKPDGYSLLVTSNYNLFYQGKKKE